MRHIPQASAVAQANFSLDTCRPCNRRRPTRSTIHGALLRLEELFCLQDPPSTPRLHLFGLCRWWHGCATPLVCLVPTPVPSGNEGELFEIGPLVGAFAEQHDVACGCARAGCWTSTDGPQKRFQNSESGVLGRVALSMIRERLLEVVDEIVVSLTRAEGGYHVRGAWKSVVGTIQSGVTSHEPGVPRHGWQHLATQQVDDCFFRGAVWYVCSQPNKYSCVHREDHGVGCFVLVSQLQLRAVRLAIVSRALPLSPLSCWCGRQLHVFGHHQSACAQAGVLGHFSPDQMNAWWQMGCNCSTERNLPWTQPWWSSASPVHGHRRSIGPGLEGQGTDVNGVLIVVLATRGVDPGQGQVRASRCTARRPSVVAKKVELVARVLRRTCLRVVSTGTQVRAWSRWPHTIDVGHGAGPQVLWVLIP